MAFIYGRRRGGRVDRCDDSFVETMFLHWNFLPLLPNSSELVLREGESVGIPRNPRSVIAGYVRGWGWAASFVSGLALGTFEGSHTSASTLVPSSLFALWIGSFFFGRLGAEEKRRRRVYRVVTGYACDPALLVHANPTLPEHLALELDTRAATLAQDAYRATRSDWRTSESDDPAFLALALTLARIQRLDDVHRRAWERLSPQLARVPERIEPTTNRERSVPQAPPPQAVAEPARVLASEPGEAFERGWDVAVRDRMVIDDGRCASCLAPTAAKRTQIRRGVRVEVPTCPSCSMHGYRGMHGRGPWLAAGFFVGLAFCALGFATNIPWFLSAPLASLCAMLSVFAASLSKPPRRAAAPATITQSAARIASARGDTITLHCTNETWARDLARRAGTEAMPKRRLFAGAVGAAWGMPLLVFPATYCAFSLAHPNLLVDNGTGRPVHVWIDGEDRGTVPPAGKDAPPHFLEVAWGEHVFAWAHEGGPRHETKASIEESFSASQWWDPGAKQCYWIVPTFYGTARQTYGSNPSPRSELHSSVHIDDWFTPSPARVQADGSGTVRHRIVRDEHCISTCDAAVIDAYWECVTKSDSDAAAEACADEFDAKCGSK